MTGDAAVGLQREEPRRKNAALGGSGADGLGDGDMFPQLHVLLPVGQEHYDPADGVRHAHMGELALQQSQNDKHSSL